MTDDIVDDLHKFTEDTDPFATVPRRLIRNAADDLVRLMGERNDAEADLAVLVGALRDMDLAIYDDGCHIVNHAEFEADPAILRRLLGDNR